MNVKPEVCNGSFARFLVMGNACNRKDARLLLGERERRCLRFLCVQLAVDFVSNIEISAELFKKGQRRMSLRYRPRRDSFKLELCHITDTYVFSLLYGNYGGSFSDINPDRSTKRVQSSLFAARGIRDRLDANKMRSDGGE